MLSEQDIYKKPLNLSKKTAANWKLSSRWPSKTLATFLSLNPLGPEIGYGNG
jgi:hypothetical protein